MGDLINLEGKTIISDQSIINNIDNFVEACNTLMQSEMQHLDEIKNFTDFVSRMEGAMVMKNIEHLTQQKALLNALKTMKKQPDKKG